MLKYLARGEKRKGILLLHTYSGTQARSPISILMNQAWNVKKTRLAGLYIFFFAISASDSSLTIQTAHFMEVRRVNSKPQV